MYSEGVPPMKIAERIQGHPDAVRTYVARKKKIGDMGPRPVSGEVSVTTRMPRDLRDRILKRAQIRGVSISHYIATCLEEVLKDA